ncbi:MNIO family bufferin maturase [Chitinibacteraceae bacterium HSL-7]
MTLLAGAGLGLRPEHYGDFIAARQPVDWLEIITDNYLVPGGKPLHYLDRIRADYPVAMHGVALNLGSTDALDPAYLADVAALARRIEPVFVSDHLCWSGVGGQYLHDLLPLPYCNEALDHVVARIHVVQEALGRELVIENVSSYLEVACPLTEWQFVAEVVRRSGCRLLLDVNNIYVSARNHGFDPQAYLAAMPTDAIAYVHLAGHTDHGTHCIDTHDHPVSDAVWQLFASALATLGPLPAMIERDGNIPDLSELLAEVARIRALQVTHAA